MNCACGKPAVGKQDACRRCYLRRLNSDPVHIAKRAAGIAARWAKPGEREKQARLCKQNVAKRDAKPGMREKYVERGRTFHAHLMSPEAKAKATSPETIARRSASLIETRLGWCPPEYRDDYRALRSARGITAAEARRMITEMVDAKRAKAERNLSPFERQERALRNGAGLQDNVRLDRFSASATELRQKLA